MMPNDQGADLRPILPTTRTAIERRLKIEPGALWHWCEAHDGRSADVHPALAQPEQADRTDEAASTPPAEEKKPAKKKEAKAA